MAFENLIATNPLHNSTIFDGLSIAETLMELGFTRPMLYAAKIGAAKPDRIALHVSQIDPNDPHVDDYDTNTDLTLMEVPMDLKIFLFVKLKERDDPREVSALLQELSDVHYNGDIVNGLLNLAADFAKDSPTPALDRVFSFVRNTPGVSEAIKARVAAGHK